MSSTHYDAIFKDLLTNPKSKLLQALTGAKITRLLATDAGWYTGRNVDYIAEISSDEYVHVEVQTGRNPVMHWRMLNYFTLLHHKLYEWKRDDIKLWQYVIYIGPGRFNMDGSHPALREEYYFEVLNMEKMETPELLLADTLFYGDRVVSLLFGNTSDDDWLGVFGAICDMHDESFKLDALFMLEQLSTLRGKRAMIDLELRKASLFDALRGSDLTRRAADRVAKAQAINMLDNFLEINQGRGLTHNEREGLEADHLGLGDIEDVFRVIVGGGERKIISQNSGLGMK